MQTPSKWRWPRLWFAMAILVATLAACDDDDTKNLDDVDGDVDDVMGDTSTDVDDTAEPDTMCTDECAAAGTTCDGDEVVTCVEGTDGCLDESRTNCADQGGTCAVDGDSAICQDTTSEMICDDGNDDDGDGATDCDDTDCATDPACVAEVCDDGTDNDGDGDTDCADEECDGQGVCEFGTEATCNDGEDNDGDGDTDCDDADCATDAACMVMMEVCDNGTDDDGDGMADCLDADCMMAPNCQMEICDNGTDDDGDGMADCLDQDCDATAGCEFGTEATCDDGADNDGDGDTDCVDSDCAGVGVCEATEATCDDGLDNDGDGTADCLDSDCDTVSGCEFGTEATCDDGADNDGDGDTDCVDADCAGVGTCEQPEATCDDGVDNDGDGTADCLDSDCDTIGTCEFGAETTCDDGVDNDGDGTADCLDSDCDTIGTCELGTEVTCDDGVDNDGDGDADCLDADCAAAAICQVPETCTDGVDNDGDGDVDCADSECTATPACAAGPVEAITGCDPTWCSLATGAGPNGGDLCTCTIPAANHPAGDDYADGACFTGSQSNPELAVTVDLTAGGYTHIAATTCTATADDSSMAVFDAADGTTQLACDEDGGSTAFCSVIDPTAAPAGGSVILSIDEWQNNSYWTDSDDRIFTFELINAPATEMGLCTDIRDNDFDGDVDCSDADCATDAACEATEVTCDDAFDNDGDGDVDCADSDCAGTAAVCEATETTCDDAFDNDADGDVDCDDADCAANAACTSGLAQPAAGEIVFTEIMYNSNDPNDTNGGEWIELYNPTGTDLDLQGCTFSDNGATDTIVFSTVVPAGGYVLFAEEAASVPTTTTPVFEWSFSYISDDSETLTLSCDDGAGGQLVVDTLTYDDAAPWPAEIIGVAIQLEPGSLTAAANDDGANWCNASTQNGITSTDIGTPGFANPVCPTETACTDGIDDDFDSFVDCADPDCAADAACEATEVTCDDAFDNDGDGDVDCADSDCAGTAAVCEATETTCDDAFDNDADGDVDCDDADCAANAACTSGLAQPAAGDIVFTEIMYNSNDPGDTNGGEWVELYNSTGADLDLQGCEFVSGTSGTQIVFSTVVPAGGYIVFGEDATGTPTTTAPAFEWTFGLLSDATDDIGLECDDGTGTITVIDTVTYDDAAPWPNEILGVAIQLDPGSLTATANDVGTNWCNASTQNGITSTDIGTPGFANPACPIETACADGLDDDNDGAIDCADADCTGVGFCEATEATCNDTNDNDGDGDVDCADVDCIGDASCVSGLPQPAAGEIVFTEIMYNSNDPNDTNGGEWVELYNSTGADLDLQGCEFVSGTSGSLIVSSTIVPAGGYVVFGEDATGTPTTNPPAFEWTFGLLSDTGDDIGLECDDGTGTITVIDTVTYDNIAPWPAISTTPPTPGVAIQLDPGSLTAADNDNALNWCYADSQSGITSTDLGTPGSANTACPAETACADGLDDDNDGAIDCADPDCSGVGFCEATELSCNDTNDNDGDGDVDCADFDCATDAACVSGQPQPAAGEVVITEIMYDSVDPGDLDGGEWIELYNPTAGDLDLQGCALTSGTASSPFVFSLVVPAGGYVVLAEDAALATHITADYDWSGVSLLTDAGDDVAIECDDGTGTITVIDEVTFDDVAPWPAAAPGTAIQLDPVSLTATDNDDGSNWCEANTQAGITSADIGTPGNPNTACALPELNCTDGVDNDTDGDVDCFDTDCALDAACGPIETLTGCDATYCTLSTGTGANGGDVCSCTIPAAQHPEANDIEAICFGSTASSDLAITIDVVGAGFNAIAATTCTATADDSSVAVFDPANFVDDAELGCDEDGGTSAQDYCSILDPVMAPAGGSVILVIDEFGTDGYWDDATNRVFEFELLNLVETCDNGTDDDGDGDIDCADTDCAGTAAICEATESTCDDAFDNDGDGSVDCADSDCTGVGFCEATEASCGDGNDNDGDGDVDCDDSDCSADVACQPVEVLTGCDPTWCTVLAVSGPNGGEVCECVIPAGNHPAVDDVTTQLCGNGGAGDDDLVVSIDMTGYTEIAATTCVGSTGDSVLELVDAGGTALACNDDGGVGTCSILSPTAATGTVTLVVEEYGTTYWNQSTDRTFQFELIGGTAPTGRGVLFSEYIEGSSNNKALEILNETGADLDLSACTVNLYSNGSATPSSSVTLSGTLANDDVYVLCDSSSAAAILAVCDLTSGVAGFNGDDAVELDCGAAGSDFIGQVGTDPGSAWTANGVSTLNQTLQRQCAAGPDTDGSDAFDPSVEWTGLAQDTFSGLGVNECAP